MRISLNKNSLKQQLDQLQMFRRFLPSLDLKRQQLLGAAKDARKQLVNARAALQARLTSLDPLFPLLGSSTLASRDLSQLVRVSSVNVVEENVVGARVPVLQDVGFEVQSYSTLVLPFWIDHLVHSLQEVAQQRVELQILQRRVEVLELAARRITQRVNLFEKVLIPNAQTNIKRIRIALSDEERAAVVRSKLAKRRTH